MEVVRPLRDSARCIAQLPDRWHARHTPVGDLYSALMVTFGADTPFEGRVRFQQDVDPANDIEDDPSFPQEETREPATISLMAVGLVGLGAAGRRRRRH
jgi:MYXO-CTERM domain-containing protein